MRLRILPMILVALAAAAVPFATAGGASPVDAVHARKAKPVPVSQSADLWATINVCDTAAKPNTIGIRGSMPGAPKPGRLLMRFQVQYFAKADKKWHNIVANADSGWKTVGITRGQVVESGQDFTFEPPTGGGSHKLRGSIRFKWVRNGRVVARARRITEAGHRTTAGADPEGYSAAVCEIT